MFACCYSNNAFKLVSFDTSKQQLEIETVKDIQRKLSLSLQTLPIMCTTPMVPSKMPMTFGFPIFCVMELP